MAFPPPDSLAYQALFKTTTVVIQNPSSLPSPFIAGEYALNGGQSSGLFDDNANGVYDGAIGASFLTYPREFAGIGVSRDELIFQNYPGAGYFNDGTNPAANLIVIANFSSWSGVYRPQFLALHMRVNPDGVTVPMKLVGGDYDAEVPNSFGTTQGVVMQSNIINNNDFFIEDGRLPAPFTAVTPDTVGFLRGSISANIFFITQGGNTLGAAVFMEFDVFIRPDSLYASQSAGFSLRAHHYSLTPKKIKAMNNKYSKIPDHANRWIKQQGKPVKKLDPVKEAKLTVKQKAGGKSTEVRKRMNPKRGR